MRWFRRIVFALIALVLLVALAGICYQAIGQARDARRSPEPGRLVDVGGYQLKLNCTGSGSPTIVLESGLGDLLVGWTRRVQPDVAQFARVCSYDRAGYGGSDAGPMPRTSAQIASELHTLLHNAGEPGPYLLVGHSFGGYSVRVFAGRYSSEVAGLVLVDTPQEDEYQLLPASFWQKSGAAQIEHYRRMGKWAPLLVNFGIARWMLREQPSRWDYLILQTKYLRARASEMERMRVSAEQARAADHISNTPLIVVAAGSSAQGLIGPNFSAQDARDFQQVWEDLQLRLAKLSQRGRREIIPGVGHDIVGERPEAIVHAVRELWAQTAARPNLN